MTELAYDYQGQDQSRFIQPKSSKLIAVPVVKVDGELSVPAEVMVSIWHRICYEGKQDLLFYDGTVTDLKGWIDYIYNPQNYVVLIVDAVGDVRHIAWINKYYQGSGFVHHCSIGNYHRKTWPTLKAYWQGFKDDDGKPLIYTVMGVTPTTNEKAVKLLRVIGWHEIGVIPGICYVANENRYVGGVISYAVINEV